MPATLEHEFLKHAVGNVLRRFSTLELYSYTESHRREFDVSCVLASNWRSVLVGQVAWGSPSSIDKDVRTLLAAPVSELKLLILRDTVEHHQALRAAMADFSRMGANCGPCHLRSLWVPPNFDASRPDHCDTIQQHITDKIAEDVLFQVVLGNITARDVQFALHGGTFGLNVALLHRIATTGFLNLSSLARDLRLSPASVEKMLTRLAGAHLIEAPPLCLLYEATQSGRVWLDVLRRVERERARESLTSELTFVLTKLDCPPPGTASFATSVHPTSKGSHSPFAQMVLSLDAARTRWGVDLSDIPN